MAIGIWAISAWQTEGNEEIFGFECKFSKFSSKINMYTAAQEIFTEVGLHKIKSEEF